MQVGLDHRHEEIKGEFEEIQREPGNCASAMSLVMSVFRNRLKNLGTKRLAH
jgi:hypothetical protein